MDERTEEQLESPWILVTLVLGTFAALYASLWLAYLFGPLVRKAIGV